MSIVSYLIVGFALGGVFFTLVAALGVIRLPDLYTRAHAVSKSDTLGVGFILIAAALTSASTSTVVKIVFLFVFMTITNPIAAHALSRSAYLDDITPWTAERGAEDE